MHFRAVILSRKFTVGVIIGTLTTLCGLSVLDREPSLGDSCDHGSERTVPSPAACSTDKPAASCGASYTDRQKRSTLYRMRRSVFDCADRDRLLYRVPCDDRCPRPAPDVTAGRHGAPEDPRARAASFTRIFRRKVWRGQNVAENPEKLTGSGRGSSLAGSARARVILTEVIELVKEFLGKEHITMLDIPCGDMTWMPLVVQNRTDVDYTGMDIVPDLIESHQKHYRNYTHMNFIQGDVVAKGLDHSYDLIFTRQMTQHLKTSDGIEIFKNISTSGSKFLLATSTPGILENSDVQIVINRKYGIDLRRFRKQNLELPPFNFAKPLCQAMDVDTEILNLWQLPLYL